MIPISALVTRCVIKPTSVAVVNSPPAAASPNHSTAIKLGIVHTLFPRIAMYAIISIDMAIPAASPANAATIQRCLVGKTGDTC